MRTGLDTSVLRTAGTVARRHLTPPQEGAPIDVDDGPAPGMSDQQVTAIRDVDSAERLVPEWTELVEDSDQDCLFLTPEWMLAWWRHFERPGWTLHLVTVRRNGRLLGLAPLCSRPSHLSYLAMFSVTQFLASGLVGSDYLDVILRRGEEASVQRALSGYLASIQPLLTLSHLPALSPGFDGVKQRLEAAGWHTQTCLVETCPYIDLCGHDWESYLDTLSASHRYNLHRRLKQLRRDGTLTFDAVEKEDHRRQALADLLRLHRLSWHGRGGSDAMQTNQEQAFHETITQTALARGWLRLFLLKLDGRPIAGLYGFRRGPRFYFYQSGFDPAWRHRSVGLVTMGLAIQEALAEGAEEFDLLHGTESYKFHWAKHTRDLIKIRLLPPSWRGRVARSIAGAEEGAKRLARRCVPERLLEPLIRRRRCA